MDTTTVFLVVILLSVISFYVGRRRSHAVSAGQGGVKTLHSLPKHYGYMAALWALLPALLVLVLWMAFENGILKNLVVAQLPANVQAMPPSEQGLYYNQIVSYARGSIDADQLDKPQVIAAQSYSALVASAGRIKALLVFLVAAIGALLALRRVHPLLRLPPHCAFSDCGHWSGGEESAPVRFSFFSGCWISLSVPKSRSMASVSG